MKKQTRQAFNFYRSYYDILDDITRDEDKLTYLMALLDRQFKGIEPTLVKIPRLVYNSQKHSIDKQVEGWENKTGAKLVPSVPPTQPPYVQEEEKGKEEEKEQVEVQEKLSSIMINELQTTLQNETV